MNKEYPLVTIITPTYNRVDFLEQTILSILEQDYPNIEYIVVDDGSEDNTVELLKRYENRLTWVSHPNMGETRTVNRGYQMAQGEYIGVVNSDDLLLPGAIQAVVKTFTENPDILVAYPGWTYIDENSNPLYEELVPEYDYAEMVRKHWCVVGPGAFISRRVFEFTMLRDEKFKYVADFEFWLRVGLYGPFKRIDGVYGTFRIHGSSASVQMKNIEMGTEHILLMENYFSLSNVPTSLKSGHPYHEAWSRAYLHAARTCPKNSREAKQFYLNSFLSYPPTLVEILRGVFVKLVVLMKKEIISAGMAILKLFSHNPTKDQ